MKSFADQPHNVSSDHQLGRELTAGPLSVDKALASRGLRPVGELALARQHGDRLKYLAGCRCAECRRANSNYSRERKRACATGGWNGIVPAAAAREHLRQLAAQGVGRGSVSAATDIADPILGKIISGTRKNIRKRTESIILAVTTDAAGDFARVPGAATWSMINSLLADGYTKGYIAIRLGRKTKSLQLHKDFVSVRNAFLVKRLYQEMHLVDASASKRLIAKLRAEGYTASQIEQHVNDVVCDAGAAPLPPVLTKARITAGHAALIKRVYKAMTA